MRASVLASDMDTLSCFTAPFVATVLGDMKYDEGGEQAVEEYGEKGG